jgi:hypothetical protein
MSYIEIIYHSHNLINYAMQTVKKQPIWDHELKTISPFFIRVYRGEKTCELRKNDRNYEVGNILYLREYITSLKTYTGRACMRIVTDIVTHDEFSRVPKGWVLMSIVSL